MCLLSLDFMHYHASKLPHDHHRHHNQSLNREGRWGTTDNFATSFLHFSLFSTALWDLTNSRPVLSLTIPANKAKEVRRGVGG